MGTHPGICYTNLLLLFCLDLPRPRAGAADLGSAHPMHPQRGGLSLDWPDEAAAGKKPCPLIHASFLHCCTQHVGWFWWPVLCLSGPLLHLRLQCDTLPQSLLSQADAPRLARPPAARLPQAQGQVWVLWQRVHRRSLWGKHFTPFFFKKSFLLWFLSHCKQLHVTAHDFHGYMKGVFVESSRKSECTCQSPRRV